MNNIVNRFFLVLVLSYSPSLLAEWGVHAYNSVSISESAQNIATDIKQLPEQHFFSNQEYGQVKRLMSRTLLAQKKQAQELKDSLSNYQDNATDDTWARVEKDHRSLTSLNTSKESLLHLTETRNRDQLTGFGPRGVTQFYAELQITNLNIKYYTYYQIRSFKKLLNDLAISPVPVISVLLKVLGIFFIFNWWMRNSDRLIHDFKTSKLKSTSNPSLFVRTIWYCSRAHKAIAYLLLITATLRIISTLPSLQHLIFLEIFTWWILGGSIAVSFILEFAYRNSKHNKKDTIALRLSTIRRYVWGIIVAGVVLQISSRTLGEGTIYAWINSIVYLFFVLLTVITLKRWNQTIFNRIEQLETHPLSVQWAIRNKNTVLMSIPATACGSAWLLGRTIQHQVISILSQYAAFSHVLAYLFRIEVAKQTEVSREQSNLVRIKGENAFNYIAPGSETSELLEEYAEEEIASLSRYLLTDSPAVCVLSGERGIGTTTVLNRILNKAKNVIPLYINCPYDGYSALLPELSQLLGLEEGATEKDILQHLRNSEQCYLIAFDNTQRLVKPKVNGLVDLMKLTNLLRRARKSHRVVLSIDKSSWRFIDRARGERLLFDLVTFMPKWNEKQIGQLLDSRIIEKNGESSISFDGLVLPRQWDEDTLTDEERAKNGFYRILWDYSDGNPTVALRFFRLSLYKDKETDTVLVRLFRAPQSDDLETMPKPMLAVLRSIVQLEVASPIDLCDCSRLSIAEVISTLRYFQSRGYIEWNDEKARISDHWYRHITNALHRQHLLVK
ncbi:ATP-binding protein [Aliivibrio finisterrensis]|uniref:AAA family ATPase n=1 Tax=Aliivibrio finisterrensis TaxID=511998 RepID=UPI001020EA24|nr:AAA family ATPase [Aliivibrio finisterrensis]RYU64629.1 ATP-binding protein [Aliivibrio finisterrensis]RYU67964.1 ATP-binding protein [Aliivibrio finisterrensis]RYU71458.1 ATP-binding protein [Aliivibrio finisterrensis]